MFHRSYFDVLSSLCFTGTYPGLFYSFLLRVSFCLCLFCCLKCLSFFNFYSEVNLFMYVSFYQCPNCKELVINENEKVKK